MSNRPTVYEVKTAELNTMQDYRYVVIFVRFKDKWIFCRHQDRTTYETAGGRIEQGESCLQAAKRELYEETGAIDFEITPLFDYSVNSSRGLSNGQVYFADVKKLGKLPESEIAFIEFFDRLPKVLTYPDIQPILFRKVKDLIMSCIAMNHNNIIIEYRLADKSDIETVTGLLCELYHTEHDELFAENAKLFADTKQVFFLAFSDGNPIGVAHCALRNEYVNGTELGGTTGYLEGIYIKAEYRLNGIAASLVARCEDWAKSNGCREFVSDCLIDNMESYKFHLALGFVETERCIFFRKEL